MPDRQRKLAAIMFTDMVRYPALVSKDEIGDGVRCPVLPVS